MIHTQQVFGREFSIKFPSFTHTQPARRASLGPWEEHRVVNVPIVQVRELGLREVL